MLDKLPNENSDIVRGPGMWELIHREFLAPTELFDDDRKTEFHIKIKGKEYQFFTWIQGLLLTGGKAGADNVRAFHFISRGYEIEWGDSSSSSHDGWFFGFYDPKIRNGYVRPVIKAEHTVFAMLF